MGQEPLRLGENYFDDPKTGRFTVEYTLFPGSYLPHRLRSIIENPKGGTRNRISQGRTFSVALEGLGHAVNDVVNQEIGKR